MICKFKFKLKGIKKKWVKCKNQLTSVDSCFKIQAILFQGNSVQDPAQPYTSYSQSEVQNEIDKQFQARYKQILLQIESPV